MSSHVNVMGSVFQPMVWLVSPYQLNDGTGKPLIVAPGVDAVQLPSIPAPTIASKVALLAVVDLTLTDATAETA